MSAGSEGSLRAVLYALAANGGIAITKFVAAAITGSGAMLAEAIHSLADCANQVLLLIGMRRARAAPDDNHPMGYGRVVYFYAMLVATLLFFVGGLFSIYEGWHRLHAPQPVTQPLLALAVLGVAIVLESFSLWGALREINKVRRGRHLLRWFRETRQSELLVVAGEDIAALAGLAFAFAAVALAVLTGNPVWDAVGSLAVGVLLIVVAVAVTVEVKAMITGESADPQVRDAIAAHVAAQPEVRGLLHLITLQWGEQVMVAV
ncbi:MAG: cation diffusion facilitator family transporter, partial [Betaproteobacteria bacterium]|nr:cation diffusion facilitator family transporter [Betaproteobacteria bacterium]